MTDITHYLGFIAGSLAGLLHAMMLWRSSHRLSAWAPLWGMLRLGMVATVLVVAAVCGEILTAAVGWAVCFAASALLCVWPRTTSEEPLGRQLNGTD